MKKYYYEGPTFKLWNIIMRVLLLNFEGGSVVPLLNFRGSRVALLNFEGVRGPGPTFTPCHILPLSKHKVVIIYKSAGNSLH